MLFQAINAFTGQWLPTVVSVPDDLPLKAQVEMAEKQIQEKEKTSLADYFIVLAKDS